MKKLNLNEVQEAKDYKSVTPGGYICIITAVEDRADKEYLYIEYDIVDGEFKRYYSDLYKSKGFWAGKFNKSYKESALSFFKSFITAIESSNPGFKWADDETKLKGKIVGLVLAEEEYRKNDGTIGTRLYVDRPRSVSAIKAKDFVVPEKKTITKSAAAASTTDAFYAITDDDDPFK